jgi:hypothetical protein
MDTPVEAFEDEDQVFEFSTELQEATPLPQLKVLKGGVPASIADAELSDAQRDAELSDDDMMQLDEVAPVVRIPVASPPASVGQSPEAMELRGREAVRPQFGGSMASPPTPGSEPDVEELGSPRESEPGVAGAAGGVHHGGVGPRAIAANSWAEEAPVQTAGESAESTADGVVGEGGPQAGYMGVAPPDPGSKDKSCAIM